MTGLVVPLAAARVDAASPPTVSVGSASVVEGASGTRSLNFTVTFSDRATSQQVVTYAVTAGSATAGVDFKVKSGSLVFKRAANGFTPVRKNVAVVVNGDAAVEGDETVAMTLTGSFGGVVIRGGAATGTILDDDPGSGTRVTVGDGSVYEGDSTPTRTVTIPVTLSQASAVPVRVEYALTAGSATAGSEFKAKSGAITFNPGQYKKTVAAIVSPDTAAESNETAVVTLMFPIGATITRPVGTVTIVDDDGQPSSTALSSSPNPSVENATVEFTATVTSAAGTPTGIVTFRDGTTTLGTAPLVAGVAVFSTSGLAPGGHLVTASYGGDLVRAPSTSAPVTQTVTVMPLTAALAGSDADGALGVPAVASVTEPSPFRVAPTVTWAQVSTGYSHKAAIATDGTLWTWGSNAVGELGLGASPPRDVPTQVGTGTDWSDVSAGTFFTLATRSDGTLWGWGENGSRTLGTGNTVDQPSPVQIGTASNWATVSAGGDRSAALTASGDLYIWGFHHQFGPSEVYFLSPALALTDVASVSVGARDALAIRTDGTLWGQGPNGVLHGGGTTAQHLDFTQTSTDTDWSQVSLDESNAFARRADGSLWGWGSNEAGQLYDGTTTFRSAPVRIGTATDWAEVRSDGSTSKARKSDGTLWTWGETAGLPVLGSTGPVAAAVGSGWASVTAANQGVGAVKADGSLWAWGRNGSGQVGPRESRTHLDLAGTWRSLRAGEGFTIGVRTDGTLWSWGVNTSGQLGDGTTTSRSTPVQVGSATSWVDVSTGNSHVVAWRDDGSLWAWGDNTFGQLGDGTTTGRSVPVRIGTANDWSKVAAGGVHTVALKQDGKLWAWGGNGSGQVGANTFPVNQAAPVLLDGISSYVAVAAGGAHSLAVRADGTLWAWGDNTYGQLGLGAGIPFDPGGSQVGTATTWSSVDAGLAHTLATRTDGTLYAWGRNLDGQLGDGTTTDRPTPVAIGTASWSRVDAGTNGSLAIRSDGTLWAWGLSWFGELGLGPVTFQTSAPTQVGTAATWRQVSLSSTHSAALRS